MLSEVASITIHIISVKSSSAKTQTSGTVDTIGYQIGSTRWRPYRNVHISNTIFLNYTNTLIWVPSNSLFFSSLDSLSVISADDQHNTLFHISHSNLYFGFVVQFYTFSWLCYTSKNLRGFENLHVLNGVLITSRQSCTWAEKWNRNHGNHGTASFKFSEWP